VKSNITLMTFLKRALLGCRFSVPTSFLIVMLWIHLHFQIEESLAKIDGSVKEAAYHAWLGYYNSIKEIGRDKTTLVELANQYCQSIGLQKPPSLFRKTALKMGLKGIPGIRTRN
jgi:hypothetical protein